MNLSDILPVSLTAALSFFFTVFRLQRSVLHYHNPSTNHHWLNESIIFAWSQKDATKCNALREMKLAIRCTFSL